MVSYPQCSRPRTKSDYHKEGHECVVNIERNYLPYMSVYRSDSQSRGEMELHAEFENSRNAHRS